MCIHTHRSRYITSDCGAVTGVQNDHHYTKTAKDTVTAVLTAGMDTDCGGFMGGKTMLPLLDDPKIMELVNTALVHLFTVQFRLGFADPPSMVPWASYESSQAISQLLVIPRPSLTCC